MRVRACDSLKRWCSVITMTWAKTEATAHGGAGILAQKGICSREALLRKVTLTDVDKEFDRRVAEAGRYVIRAINKVALSQAQFDALVSLTYNGVYETCAGRMTSSIAVISREPRTIFPNGQSDAARRWEEKRNHRSRPGQATCRRECAISGETTPRQLGQAPL